MQYGAMTLTALAGATLAIQVGMNATMRGHAGSSTSASPAAHSSPLVATTQMPKSSGGTRASAGYTLEVSPRSSDL